MLDQSPTFDAILINLLVQVASVLIAELILVGIKKNTSFFNIAQP